MLLLPEQLGDRPNQKGSTETRTDSGGDLSLTVVRRWEDGQSRQQLRKLHEDPCNTNAGDGGDSGIGFPAAVQEWASDLRHATGAVHVDGPSHRWEAGIR